MPLARNDCVDIWLGVMFKSGKSSFLSAARWAGIAGLLVQNEKFGLAFPTLMLLPVARWKSDPGMYVSAP